MEMEEYPRLMRGEPAYMSREARRFMSSGAASKTSLFLLSCVGTYVRRVESIYPQMSIVRYCPLLFPSWFFARDCWHWTPRSSSSRVPSGSWGLPVESHISLDSLAISTFRPAADANSCCLM